VALKAIQPLYLVYMFKSVSIDWPLLPPGIKPLTSNLQASMLTTTLLGISTPPGTKALVFIEQLEVLLIKH